MTARVIELPTPPSINDAYADFVIPAKNGKKARAMRMLKDEGKRYKADVAAILHHAGWTPTAQDVILTIWWRRQRRAGDLSNRVKVLEDALKGCAYHDDSQVVELHAFRSDDRDRAGVTVSVELVPMLTEETRQEALALRFSTASSISPAAVAILARGSDLTAAAESYLSAQMPPTVP